MRILSVGGLVPWHPEAGGGQIIAYKTSEALAGQGHEVHYLAIAPRVHQRQVRWGEIEYTLSGPSLQESVQLGLHLARSASLAEYDVVHVHLGGETVAFCLAYALARKMGLKSRLVLSLYAPRAYAFPRSVGEVITALSCHSADLLLSLSDFSKRDISRAYRVSSSRIAVTYAGVDPSFTPHSRPRAREKGRPFRLMFCGRLNGPHEQKGVDVLLKSLPLILSRHEVVLDIVGTGPRLDQYRALAQELKVESNVRFLGFLEHERMPARYAAADLFVLPSRRESFGLVLAEAMACGLPVVATTAGAIPEVVDKGMTGLLVPPDDPQAFADAVSSLLADPSRMKIMGLRGKERVADHFTWDKVARRVIDGYHKVL